MVRNPAAHACPARPSCAPAARPPATAPAARRGRGRRCSRSWGRACSRGSRTTIRPASRRTRSSAPTTATGCWWVLTVSTVALIAFHDLAARMGVVTGKGLLALVREHYGWPGTAVALPALRQPRDAVRGVRRDRGRPGARRRRQPLHQRPGRRRRRVRARAAGLVSPCRAHPAGAERGLAHVRRRRLSRAPRLERNREGTRRAQHPADARRPARRRRDRRHDACALGACVHPVLRGQQAPARRGPALRARRRGRRRRADRDHRRLRRRRLRRDAVPDRGEGQ